MKIGVIIPMDSEYRQMQQLIGGDTGMLGDNEIVLSRCGIGKVNAALGTQQLINDYQPDCIINTGVAGGIDCGLNVMDVVVADECVYHDVWCGEPNAKGQVQGMPERFESNRFLYELALSVEGPLHGGLVCTGDQFITNEAALKHIKEDFPEGLAVDMESCAIAQTCYVNEVPFLALRIISDIPSEAKTTEEHKQKYDNFWQTLADNSFITIKHILESLGELMLDEIPE